MGGAIEKVMQHTNYFEIKADTYFGLGSKEGQLFWENLKMAIKKEKEKKDWDKKILRSKKYLLPTKEAFPNYIEELEGYARGAGVSFEDLWVLSLEGESDEVEKCTTVISNNGKLIAHNEDWNPGAKDAVCVLKRSIKGVTTLELFYYNTLGGSGISINSHGFVQTINTLPHLDQKDTGIPRNVIARFLSETKSPEVDFKKIAAMDRSAGYNHNLIYKDGEIWNLELSATRQIMQKPTSPFIHTNHFLSCLKDCGGNNDRGGTLERYQCAKQVSEQMSLDEMKELMSDDSDGRQQGIFNERTIGRVIVDLTNRVMYIWLLREQDKGWIKYSLDFIE